MFSSLLSRVGTFFGGDAEAGDARAASSPRNAERAQEHSASTLAVPSDTTQRRLTTENEADELCHERGWCRRRIPADGNCLFRAVSEQVYGDQSRTQELREAVAEHIESEADRYAPFLERPLDEYVSLLRRDGTWGGDLEILALSRLLGRRVVIASARRDDIIVDARDEGGNAPDILLWFSHDNHYDALYVEDDFTARGFDRIDSNAELARWEEEVRGRYGGGQPALDEAALDDELRAYFASRPSVEALVSAGLVALDDIRREIREEEEKKA